MHSGGDDQLDVLDNSADSLAGNTMNDPDKGVWQYAYTEQSSRHPSTSLHMRMCR